ncbi:uncharacterized protein METZ01_LOCUS165595, partial [marine metagenome]
VPSHVSTGPLPLQLEIAEENRRGIAEYGLTTARRRRKAAGTSWPHLQEAIMLNSPTQIALACCNHLDARYPSTRPRRLNSTRPRPYLGVRIAL